MSCVLENGKQVSGFTGYNRRIVYESLNEGRKIDTALLAKSKCLDVITAVKTLEKIIDIGCFFLALGIRSSIACSADFLLGAGGCSGCASALVGGFRGRCIM